MFSKLQAKWKVKGWQLTLILITFALGGSLTGLAGRTLLGLTGMERGVLYYILYVLIITAIWPVAVIVVSIPFGQYAFFVKYLRKMWQRMTGKKRLMADSGHVADAGYQLPVAGLEKNSTKLPLDNTDPLKPDTPPLVPHPAIINIAIFASGSGSNAQKIIDYFRYHPTIKIGLIVCNKPGAGVLAIAKNESIARIIIEKETFFKGNAYVDALMTAQIDFIVLAGFLWKIPVALIKAYTNKIVNIHPALLPKYGGKGMYGHFVHEAVIANGDTESGITIHYVDEHYDHGNTIFQATCPVLPGDTAAVLATRVLQLEHEHYAAAVEECVKKI